MVFAGYYPDYGWKVYFPYPTDLLPNQTVNGYLKYEIIRGIQPTQLLYPDENSPTIIVDFG